MACEDYPCCGHGPPPMGDGGSCPTADGRFGCIECGELMPKNASSSICGRCQRRLFDNDLNNYYEDEGHYFDNSY